MDSLVDVSLDNQSGPNEIDDADFERMVDLAFVTGSPASDCNELEVTNGPAIKSVVETHVVCFGMVCLTSVPSWDKTDS